MLLSIEDLNMMETASRTSLFTGVQDVVQRIRAVGSTFLLMKAFGDPLENSVVVVATQQQAKRLQNDFKISENRLVPLRSLDMVRGVSMPFAFDNYAVYHLAMTGDGISQLLFKSVSAYRALLSAYTGSNKRADSFRTKIRGIVEAFPEKDYSVEEMASLIQTLQNALDE